MAKKKTTKKQPVKVKEIIPCVCTEHTPNCGDSSHYGMPDLSVYMSKFTKRPRSFYSAFCPNCGRGSKLGDFKTPDEALADWNRVQRSCYAAAHRTIQFFDWNIEEEGQSIEEINPEQVRVKMDGTDLKIYLYGSIFCLIPNGRNDPDFIEEILYGLGYKIVEGKEVE